MINSIYSFRSRLSFSFVNESEASAGSSIDYYQTVHGFFMRKLPANLIGRFICKITSNLKRLNA